MIWKSRWNKIKITGKVLKEEDGKNENNLKRKTIEEDVRRVDRHVRDKEQQFQMGCYLLDREERFFYLTKGPDVDIVIDLYL
jgi:hypothetical protein